VGRSEHTKGRSADESPWLPQLFTAIDAGDTPRFLGFLAEDATFRFGNQPALKGRVAIGAAVQAFFGSIKACRHEVLGSWRHPDSVVCHGRVTYTRADATRVTVPFANVMLTRGELVSDYFIFVDLAPLFAE
jgi:ketosteroid isomerase-like protein